MSPKTDRPTIKGTYILSHIQALFNDCGQEAIDDLRSRYGKNIDFQKNDNVPVADEVAILENIVDIRSPKRLTKEERALAAGHLHFKNFTSTPIWVILAPFARANIHMLLMQSHYIANKVFHGVLFTSENVSPTTVRIKLANNDYPLEHFQGFFEEWIIFSRQIGAVEADIDSRGAYVYTITWR
jgi:hypothetical protein